MAKAAPNKKKILKIVLWCVIGVLLLAVIVPVSSLLVQKFVKKATVPMFLGCGWSIVITPSMTPEINVGDLVIIKKTDDYRVHDVVMYDDGEGKLPVTHRIIYYDEETKTYTTKGDANLTPDFPITEDKIYGEVVAVIPYVGLFFEWFTNEGGIIYIAALLAVIVACVYFWNLTKPQPQKESNEASNALQDANEATDSNQAEAEHEDEQPKDNKE